MEEDQTLNTNPSVKRADDEHGWDKDKLNREKHGKCFVRFLQKTEGPFVIGLTSSWGTGKTFFLRSMEKDLDDAKLPCVYFTAWENDFGADPLISMLGTINSELARKEYLEKNALAVLACLGSVIVSSAVHAFNDAVASKTGLNVLELKDRINQAKKTAGSEILDKFLAGEESKQSFETELKELLEKIKAKHPASSLIVFIDELDRCRPDYTISLLERIKHLFSVPGIVFVLSIDLDQLLMIIEHTFGIKPPTANPEEDSRLIYLEKFIDMYYQLPEISTENFIKSKLDALITQEPRAWNPSSHILQGNNAREAFHAILAQEAYLVPHKSLRAISRIITEYYALCQCYDFQWYEAFYVFHILINQDSGNFKDRKNRVINGKSYINDCVTQLAASSERYKYDLVCFLICMVGHFSLPDFPSQTEGLPLEYEKSICDNAADFQRMGLLPQTSEFYQNLQQKLQLTADFFQPSPTGDHAD